MENTLIRSAPCPVCGAEMLWTQNAWQAGGAPAAGYRCVTGHLLDPAGTRQCPACGVHDTELVNGSIDDGQEFRCLRCGEVFRYPRDGTR
jgi:transposase-like protein